MHRSFTKNDDQHCIETATRAGNSRPGYGQNNNAPGFDIPMEMSIFASPILSSLGFPLHNGTENLGVPRLLAGGRLNQKM